MFDPKSSWLNTQTLNFEKDSDVSNSQGEGLRSFRQCPYSTHVSGATSSACHRVYRWKDPTDCHVSQKYPRSSNQVVSSSGSRFPDKAMSILIGFCKIEVRTFATTLEAFHRSKILRLRRRSDSLSCILWQGHDVWSAVQIVTTSAWQTDRACDRQVCRNIDCSAFQARHINSEIGRNVNIVCCEIIFQQKWNSIMIWWDGIWCGSLRRFVFYLMGSGLVARAVHENDRNGLNSAISFLYGTHFVLPTHNFKVQSSCEDTWSIVQLFFTTVNGAGLRLFVEDHDKDDSRCEDVVERDADGYATQKL